MVLIYFFVEKIGQERTAGAATSRWIYKVKPSLSSPYDSHALT
jgi:hypothetical protein